MRTVNGKKLKTWLERQGDRAKAQLHLDSGVSMDWIEKVTSGRYKSAPRRITINALCEATGMSEDELFPLAATKGRAS